MSETEVQGTVSVCHTRMIQTRQGLPRKAASTFCRALVRLATSLSEPFMTSMPCCSRERALGESTLRVKARSFGGLGNDRRERRTALPCLPVAPMTRIRLVMVGEARKLPVRKQHGPVSPLGLQEGAYAQRAGLRRQAPHRSRRAERGRRPRSQAKARSPDVRSTATSWTVQRITAGLALRAGVIPPMIARTPNESPVAHSRASFESRRSGSTRARMGKRYLHAFIANSRERRHTHSTSIVVSHSTIRPSVDSGRGGWPPCGRWRGTASGSEPGTRTGAGRSDCRLQWSVSVKCPPTSAAWLVTHQANTPRRGKTA